MKYLTLDEVVVLNGLTVTRHGGNFVPPHNFLHGEALEYLIETVQADMFGAPLYPTVSDKAGLYLFNIISNHIFQDGNKRTGLGAALAFLLRNGYWLKEDLMQITYEDRVIPTQGIDHDDHLFQFTLAVASAEVPLPACQQWFATNITTL